MTSTAPDPTAASTPRPMSMPASKGVLHRDSVRVMSQPALVDCSSNDQGRTLTVVPLMDGDRVAGIEVRCSCGSSTLIECVYQPEANR